MSIDAQAAGSSPAPDTLTPTSAADHAVVSGDQAAYRDARRAERVGKPLTPTPAESAPAEPAEQAASTDAQTEPASEPGKPRKNADTRVKELLAERARERERAERAERELAALRSGSQPSDASPAASSPAPAKLAIAYPPEIASFDAYQAAHPESSYDEYMDARADYRFEQREQHRETTQREHQTRAQRAEAIKARDTKFQERIDAAIAADPEFVGSLSDDVKRLRPFDAIRDAQGRWTEQPSGYNAIAEEVLASEVSVPLLRHFSDHPEDLHRIAKLLPNQLVKEMARLEDRYTSGKAAAAPPKTVTDAPPPPTVLGGRPGSPADPLDAAVESGDQAAFKAAKLRQRLAQRG